MLLVAFVVFVLLAGGWSKSWWMCSLYFKVQVSDFFRNGCQATLALAHASQNLGFNSGSSWISVMWPFAIVYLMAAGAM